MATEQQMIEAMRRRRGPPKALLFAIPVVLVAIVGVAFFLMRGGNKAEKSFSALSRCLIGEPLKPGENVFFRVREAELGTKPKNRENPATAWPARCASHATALYRSVDSGGKGVLLRRLLTEQLGCGDAESQPCKFAETGHPLGKADEIWKAAEISGLRAGDAPDVPAPDRLKPENGADWPVLVDAEYALSESRVADNGELWLLLNPTTRKGRKSPRLCRILESGAKARCNEPKLPELTGPIRFVDGREPAALSGTAVTDEGTEEGAFSLVDAAPIKVRAGMRNGYALERRGKDFYLLEVAEGLVKEQKKLSLPDDTQAHVFDNWLGWFETTDNVRQLVWRKIGAGAELEGDTIKLEGEPPRRVDTCSAPGGYGAAYGRSDNPAKQTVWFSTPNGWSKPVSGPMEAGQREEWSLLCTKERATRFWVLSGDTPKIGVLDCKPSGCEKREVEWKGAKARRWLAVTELGGQTAALMETFDDDKRLYLAPFDKLAEAPPLVLMDGPEFSGPKFENTRIVITPELVLVLFTTDKGMHGLFVNAKARGPVGPG